MNRLAPLDGFRAVAVLLVMLGHAKLSGSIPGGLGVTIFFFLSGYLITTLMVREWDKSGQVDFRAFYLRRVVRIIPPMLIAITIAAVLGAAGLGPLKHYLGILWDLVFLSNYARELPSYSGIAIPLWSLSVEEHFYLLFPVLFVAVRSRGSTIRVAQVCLALSLAVLAVRIAYVAYAGPQQGIYFWTHTRFDSILFGCLLATWNNPATDDRTRVGGHGGWAILGAALILTTIAVRDPVMRDTIRYTAQGAGLWLIFNYSLRTDGITSRVLSSLPLRFVADLSYFLYLIHYPLLIAAKALPIRASAQVVVAFALSFLMAILVRQFMEKPLYRWRDRQSAKIAARADPAEPSMTETAVARRHPGSAT